MNRFPSLAVRLLCLNLSFGLIAAASAQNPAAWGGSAFVPSLNSARKINRVSIGVSHAILVRNDGTVVQTGALSGTAMPAGLVNPLSVSAGNDFSLAVTSSGAIVGWGGANNNPGRTNIPTGSNFVRVRAGTQHGAAIRADGTFALWGKNTSGEATAPTGLTTVKQIAVGTDFMVAISSTGALRAWGRTTGNTNGSLVGTVPAGVDFVDVRTSPDGFHAVALRQDGSVVAWGLNSSGQTTVPAQIASPDHVNFKRVRSIAAGSAHSVALLEDGTTMRWGSNTAGQLNAPTWTEAYEKIYAGGTTTLALTYKPTATVTFDLPDVVGGSTKAVTGTVTLAKPATEALDITLESSAPTAAGVPETVSIPAGATSATFSVSHQPVNEVVTVTARTGRDVSVARGRLRVGPNRVATVTTSVPTVLVGKSLTGTVEVAEAMQSVPTVVSLGSLPGVSMPATVSIPAGSRTATFEISTTSSTAAGVYPVNATIAGRTRTRTFNVAPIPRISDVRVPATLWGNSSVIGQVVLGSRSPEDTVVSIALDNNHLSAPATVTIRAGQLTGAFTINIDEVDIPLEKGTISASFANSLHNKIVDIRPNISTALALSSAVVPASTKEVTATVTIKAVAKNDTEVAVSATIPGSVPSTVTVKAGSKSASFPVTVRPEDAGKINQITVSKHGAKRTARLQITP